MQGMAERITYSPSRGTLSMEYVRVTQRTQLPREMLVTAYSPLDALVQWCDRHNWYTEGAPQFADPPHEEIASAYASHDPAIRVRLRILPMQVNPEPVYTTLKSAYMRHTGTYRLTVVDP